MIVRETSNIDDVKKIIFDPEIYERIKIGDSKPELTTKNTRYIGAYLNNEIIGVLVYYTRKNYTTCHIQVLKAHRAALAVKFGRIALGFSHSEVLFTNAPKQFTDVIRFIKYFNFKKIGSDGDSLIFKRG